MKSNLNYNIINITCNQYELPNIKQEFSVK